MNIRQEDVWKPLKSKRDGYKRTHKLVLNTPYRKVTVHQEEPEDAENLEVTITPLQTPIQTTNISSRVTRSAKKKTSIDPCTQQKWNESARAKENMEVNGYAVAPMPRTPRLRDSAPLLTVACTTPLSVSNRRSIERRIETVTNDIESGIDDLGSCTFDIESGNDDSEPSTRNVESGTNDLESNTNDLKVIVKKRRKRRKRITMPRPKPRAKRRPDPETSPVRKTIKFPPPVSNTVSSNTNPTKDTTLNNTSRKTAGTVSEQQRESRERRTTRGRKRKSVQYRSRSRTKKQNRSLSSSRSMETSPVHTTVVLSVRDTNQVQTGLCSRASKPSVTTSKNSKPTKRKRKSVCLPKRKKKT